MTETIFTSESVTAGHPDKLCDQISDAAIDAFVRLDSGSRATVECALASGILFIALRYVASAIPDLASIARGVIADAGYADGDFDARNCSILTNLTRLPDAVQPPSTDNAVEASSEQQVNAFGYACHETPQYMPLPIAAAHSVARQLDRYRLGESPSVFAPDGKIEVSVRYRDDWPVAIDAITVNVGLVRGHSGDRDTSLEAILREELLPLAFADYQVQPDNSTSLLINPAGEFVVGGPAAHAGLTGRKIGVDTYGDFCRQSGSALSGKDMTRVDRIATYAARYVAKALVVAGLAERCEVHLAYGIGSTAPTSLRVATLGTGKLPDEILAKSVVGAVDLSVGGLLGKFAAHEHIKAAGAAGYLRRLAIYGHVGRQDLQAPWELDDLSVELAAKHS